MGRPRTTACKVCERSTDECGPLSARKKCKRCGEHAMIESARQINAHRGPRFDHWRRQMAASVGASLPQ